MLRARFAVVAFAVVPLIFGVSSAATGAATTPRGVVPFHGRFRVTATWGASTGSTHATPAIDFAMPIGTPVYAAGNGVVDFTSTDPRTCTPLKHGTTTARGIQWCIDHGLNGTRIRIHHDNRTYTMYVHLSRIRSGITTGTRVRTGQPIAWSGNSGISSGPHLHFSRINTAGTATIDPGILRACWGSTRHNYTNLKQLRGKVVRSDNSAC